jgi:nucleoside phosphorylase
VIASSERAALIAKSSRKIVAIEMEALGVIEACLRFDPPVPALVVKAVSDLADESKDDTWHPFASRASASLAIELLRAELI